LLLPDVSSGKQNRRRGPAAAGTMAKKTFEQALAKLEQITAELEAGDLSLEKSLDKFNEGIELVQFCNSRLEEAKSRVDLLLKKDGELVAVPFAEDEGGNSELSE
jgi:exodeoxyribonuclease VII small subunit